MATTHRHAIENRSEELLVNLLSVTILVAEARVVTAYGPKPTASTRYPAVTCLCISAEEEVSQTGIYRARCQIHVETYHADDTDGSDLSNLVGEVRLRLQSNLETELSATQVDAFIHRILLADSNREVEGDIKRVEIGVDLIWSPTDS